MQLNLSLSLPMLVVRLAAGGGSTGTTLLTHFGHRYWGARYWGRRYWDVTPGSVTEEELLLLLLL